MRLRNLIIIDDEPDYDGIDNMCDDLHKDGISVKYKIFNPKDKEYADIEVFYKDLKKYLRENHIQMIACDYTLGSGLDGIALLGKIKNDWHHSKITNLLFSTKLDAILKDIIESDTTVSDKVVRLKRLVQSNSIDFPDRKQIFNVLKGHLRGDGLHEIDIKHELLQWLHSFENHQFMGHPSLERRTLGKIASEIENDTALGVEFQKLFVEQGVSAMIELNNLPNHE